jgi:glucosylceramidase
MDLSRPGADIAAGESEPLAGLVCWTWLMAHPLRRWSAACLVLALLCLLAGPGRAAADAYSTEVVQTTQDERDALTRLPDAEFGPLGHLSGPVVSVNAGRRFQTIAGFGAAMTDTSAWLIEREASPSARGQLLSDLFGPDGIHLSFLRVPIGASDFTATGRPYTYDDVAPGQTDPALRRFSIAHDRAWILPALRQARALEPSLQLLASPWTAPAWMKANDALDNLGGRGILRPAAELPWAHYFVDFLRDYAAAGVPIDALTLQNEPGAATSYPGMTFPAAAQATWLTGDLDPALAAAGLHPRIYGGDLGWALTSQPFMDSIAAGGAGRALSGVSWHCYYGSPDVMSAFRATIPRLSQIVDECSPGGISPTPTSEIVISSLRDWASTVALWNLALDPRGGPVQAPNRGCPGCVGLATVDERSGGVWLTRSYDQLGQASAFIAPGAQRIASGHFVSYRYPGKGIDVASPGLDDVAVRNPDGSLVLVAYDNAPTPAPLTVLWRGRALRLTLAPRATVTLVWNRPGA